MREKPVTIEVRKAGQHWAVYAEEQLITQTVFEKGAHTLEAVLRGCLRYTSRKLFRLAVSDAMKPPKPVETTKSAKASHAQKPESASPEVKPKKPANKKAPVKKEQITNEAPTPPPAAPSDPASDVASTDQAQPN